MILQGPPALGIHWVLLSLAFSVAAIVLATLVAAPARRSVSLSTKITAVPSVLSGGLGVLSSTMWFFARTREAQIGLSTDSRLAVLEPFVTQRAVQNAFFSACTFALAILVLASRRSS